MENFLLSQTNGSNLTTNSIADPLLAGFLSNISTALMAL